MRQENQYALYMLQSFPLFYHGKLLLLYVTTLKKLWCVSLSNNHVFNKIDMKI